MCRKQDSGQSVGNGACSFEMGPRCVGDRRAAWRRFRQLETGPIGANGNEVACPRQRVGA